MNRFQDIAIMITIFISSYVFFKSPVEGYVSYIVYAIYFPVYIAKFGFPRQPFLIFIPLLISGMVYVQSGQNTFDQFLKIFLGFFSSVLFYNYVFQVYKFDLKYLFKLYMKGAYWVSIIGIFQLLSFWVGFKQGYDFGWVLNKWSVTPGGLGIRMNSVFSEPSYFAAVVAPAFFIATFALLKRKKHLFIPRRGLLIIFFAYFLTYSSLGFIGVFVILIMLLANLGFVRYALIIAPTMWFGFDYAYNNIDEFRDRLDGMQEVFGTQNIRSYNKVHGSSFVLANSYHVASENFKEYPIFGTGLGSHPTAYEKHSLTNIQGIIKIDFNKQDANSMALRLMSETGLYGLIFMAIFLYTCFLYKPRVVDEEIWLISTASLIIIILYLARQGHYFLNGFPFFLWMYYFAWRQRRDSEEVNLEDNEAATESAPDTV